MALCALLLVLSTHPVMAGQNALSIKSHNVTTANWSVIAVGSNQSATNTPYLLTWTVSSGTAYNFFNLRNTGSVAVSDLNMTISQSRLGGSGPANSVEFELCSGGLWNSVTNTCNGSVVLLGKASDLVIIFANLLLNPTSELSIRARTAVSGRNNFSTQLDIYVSRAGVRLPIVSQG